METYFKILLYILKSGKLKIENVTIVGTPKTRNTALGIDSFFANLDPVLHPENEKMKITFSAFVATFSTEAIAPGNNSLLKNLEKRSWWTVIV